jgi:hypothetical protein
MPTVAITPQPKLQFFDAAGNPLSGGKLYTYAAGTTTPLASYTDSTGNVANTNPVILDSRGEASVWLGASQYKLALYTSADVLVWTVDNVSGSVSLAQLAASNGSSFVNFLQAGTGATSRTVQSKLRDVVSVLDFGADPTGATSSTTAFASAVSASAGKALYVPAGSYSVADEFTLAAGTTIYGDGFGSRISQTAQGKNVFILADDCMVSSLRVVMTAGNTLDISKQNAVYATGRKRVCVADCWIQSAENCCGIQFVNTTDFVIRNNIVWNGYWDGVSAGVGATVADILFYSGTAGGRGVIDGNRCLSNNSQGISVNTLGYDTDCSVANNVCVTMNASTWTEQASGGNRRHGILVAYIGGTASRLSVVGNICRNTRWTGIYLQSDGSGNAQNVTVTGNVCSLNGQDTTQSLAGGIFVATNGGEIVSSNVITAFAGTSGNGAIVVTASAIGGVSGTSVVNNTVQSSAGVGIFIANRARDVFVDGNYIQGSADRDIFISQTAGDSALGGHQIRNNIVVRSNASAESLRVDLQAGNRRVTIAGNQLRGFNNATAAATNAGVSVAGVGKPVDILDNTIDTYYYGVDFTNYQTASTRFFNEFCCDRNFIQNCNQGIGIGSTAATCTIPLEANVFANNTSDIGGGSTAGFVAGYAAIRLDGTITFRSAASPTNGTWAVSDRAVITTAATGQPKAWVCTVAGTPGTWTSEGNL